MTRLSSRSTWFSKRMFPVLWFGVIAFFLVYSLSGNLPRGGIRALLVLGPILIAVVGYLAMKRLLFSLMDEVWDAGSELVIRNQGREARVSLTNVASVSYSVATRPQRVTLRLRQSTPFGKEISFAAPSTWIPFARNPHIEDLIAKVEDAGPHRR